MSAALLDLAARCEKASGPDRELDVAIWRAVERPDAPESKVPLPWLATYTASLDAAMSLVPDGCFIAALGDIAADGLPGCCLSVSTDPLREVWGVAAGGGADRIGRLARAISSASIRARAVQP